MNFIWARATLGDACPMSSVSSGVRGLVAAMWHCGVCLDATLVSISRGYRGIRVVLCFVDVGRVGVVGALGNLGLGAFLYCCS
jgi:hypothetical protein